MVHGERGGGRGTEEWKKDGPGVISDEAQAKLKELETPSVTYVSFAPWFASLVCSNVGGGKTISTLWTGDVTDPADLLCLIPILTFIRDQVEERHELIGNWLWCLRENMAGTDVKKRGIEVGEGGNNDVIQQASKKFRPTPEEEVTRQEDGELGDGQSSPSDSIHRIGQEELEEIAAGILAWKDEQSEFESESSAPRISTTSLLMTTTQR